MKPKFLCALLALAVVASACASRDGDSLSLGGDASDGTVSGEVTTSTRRTIPEEAITTIQTTTTVSEPLDPLPEQDWEGQQLRLVTLAQLEFPTALSDRAGGDDLWIAERPGRVRQIQRRVDLDGEAQTLRLMNTVVLDITDKVSDGGERGLLGIAFSSNGRLLYVSYSDNNGRSVLAEYEMGTIAALPDSERILMVVDQPQSNHNGGQVSFGPDGFLYWALGDGGGSGDPGDHGQNRNTLLGSILRIDPAQPGEELPYQVPADNPFSGSSDGRDEIWLWGVRNPWKFSFDMETGDLWIADVGQNELEEINLLRNGQERAGRGANLGWNIAEGDRLFSGDEFPPDHRPPIFTYDHSNGRCSITGGYAYRGDLNRPLKGVYLFADFCTGEVFGLEATDDGRITVANMLFDRATGQVVGFGQDAVGELYLLEADGRVSLIQRPGVGPTTQVVSSDQDIRGGEIDEETNVVPDPGDGG
ncbi:MAG: PQQ-dependent sugar dehydrogenase [Actinomycetota bacterium]